MAEELPRVARLLWSGTERSGRGRRPALTLDRIVEAAIAIADADGIGALSMQRVATELGSATMSLYRHVPSKDDLVALMLDTAMAERLDLPMVTGGQPSNTGRAEPVRCIYATLGYWRSVRAIAGWARMRPHGERPR